MLLEDAVALLGILLTLIVAGVSFTVGPRPVFDAIVAIAVGVLLGAMALFLAALNRRLLIDSSDPVLDRMAQRFLAEHGVDAELRSIVLDDGHDILFVHVRTSCDNPMLNSHALGEALKAYAQERLQKTINHVYWHFPAPPLSR